MGGPLALRLGLRLLTLRLSLLCLRGRRGLGIRIRFGLGRRVRSSLSSGRVVLLLLVDAGVDAIHGGLQRLDGLGVCIRIR